MIRSLLRRFWQCSPAPVAPVLYKFDHAPIPLAERQPGPADLGGLWDDCCWWGHWQGDRWLWIWDSEPVRGETHWLPATAELLPARCCPPEPRS